MIAERAVRSAYQHVAHLADPGRTLRQLAFYLLAAGPHAPAPGAVRIPDGHALADVEASDHPGQALEAALDAIAEQRPELAPTVTGSGLARVHLDRKGWRRLLGLVDPAAGPWESSDVLGLIRLWTGSPGGQRIRGAFYTPARAGLALARLTVDAPAARVVDPCCGAGALLVAAYQRMAELGDEDCWLVGCDIDAEAVEAAALNLAVHGARRFTLHHGNALTTLDSEAPWRTWASGGPARPLRLAGADVVLSNPPFGALGDSIPRALLGHPVFGKRTSKARPRGEIVHLAAAVAMLAPGGRAGLVVPDSLLSTSRDAETRRALLEDLAAVEAVVSLPAEAFVATGTNCKTSLLLLQPGGVSADDADGRVVMGVCERIGWTSRGQRCPSDLDDVERGVGELLAEERARRAGARTPAAPPATTAETFDGRLFDIAELAA